MKKIAQRLTDLVGNTPLLELNNYGKNKNLKARVIVKLEYFNPAGSVKDRVALAMIEDAETKGLLKPGATVIEPTSGNTGVGLAFVAASKGYKLILTMPDTMSTERRNLLKALGAELVLTPGADGMKGAIARAEELQASTPGSLILQQFNNRANPAVHERTTGQEIWQDTDGKVDIFVAGVGTGGTVSSVGAALKKHNSRIQVVAVEPEDSPVLSGGKPGPHKIQGIGAGFVPKNYNSAVVDGILQVSNDDAIRTLNENQLAAVLPRLDHPHPRILAGQALRGLASSALDLSDGLASDLGHILKASGVRAQIDLNLLPLSPVLQDAVPAMDAWQLALAGGDDYELCFTVPQEHHGALDTALANCGVKFTRIGRILVGEPGIDYLQDEQPVELHLKGWDHFA
jgi:cysteine synthase A